MAPDLPYFRGQIDNEKIILFSRKHWIVLLPEIIPFVFCITILGLCFSLFSHHIRLSDVGASMVPAILVLLVVVTSLLIHRFFLHLIDYFLTVVIITDRRIVDIRKTLFLHDTKESIAFSEVQDVAFFQEGFFKNLLKFGELSITLGGGKEIKIFTQIPNPDYHFRVINTLKNQLLPQGNEGNTSSQLFHTPAGDLSLPTGNFSAPFVSAAASSLPAVDTVSPTSHEKGSNGSKDSAPNSPSQT